jgi:hypothetical protein
MVRWSESGRFDTVDDQEVACASRRLERQTQLLLEIPREL